MVRPLTEDVNRVSDENAAHLQTNTPCFLRVRLKTFRKTESEGFVTFLDEKYAVSELCI